MVEEPTQENESPVEPPAEETPAGAASGEESTAETSTAETGAAEPRGAEPECTEPRDTEPQSAATPAQSGRYDFGEAQRLSGAQLRHLQQVHDRFAKELATSLAALTRRNVKPAEVSCSQVENGEADRELAQCGLLIALDADPLDARVTLGMNSALVFPLLEALLGGKVAGGTDVHRELTEIELSVLQDLHAVLVRELERAWRSALRLTLRVVEQQMNPHAGISNSSNDGLLLALVNFEVESIPGRISLFYPARIGREIQGGEAPAASDVVRRPEIVQQAIFKRLQSSVVAIEGRLLGATMSLKDLSDLRAGDVVCLDIPLDKPIDIAINGSSRFNGRLADAGRRRALRIHEVVPAKVGERWPR